MQNLTAKQITEVNGINILTIDMGLGTKINTLISEVNELTINATPVNAVAATNTITIAGAVIDGETASIGHDIYEFVADEALTVTTVGNIPVDISQDTTAGVVTLTIDTQPTSGNTMTIGGKVYTFVPVGTDNADGEVSVGTSLAEAKLAIVAAINGTDGHNIAHTLVSCGAFIVNDLLITALVGGTTGNSISTVETFTAGTNIFSSATLLTGADCSAADAITALVAAVTANDTVGVSAVDGAGDTVDLIADVAGVLGNAITLEVDMVNAVVDTTTFTNGVNGTVAKVGQSYIDSSYLYRCVADNTVSGANWRRISLGSAF